MANRERGQVALKVGDDEFIVAFTMNAICELEAETDMSFTALVDELSDVSAPPAFHKIRRMLRAGLIDGAPGITLQEVGDLADRYGMTEITEVLTEALTLKFEGDAPKKKTASPRKS